MNYYRSSDITIYTLGGMLAALNVAAAIGLLFLLW
jgi:hypothetical protein